MFEEKYLLDTDALISAKNSYYSFKLCPGFWDCLIYYSKKRRICSLDKVREEIQRGNDDLVLWVDKLNDFFHDTSKDSDVLPHYKEIINWITHKSKYKIKARERFASGADPWLIAFAKVYDRTLVTNETSHPDSKKKIKIPDICKRYNVKYVNTFGMLRGLKVQFNWNEV